MTEEEWRAFADPVPADITKLTTEFRSSLSQMFGNLTKRWLDHHFLTEQLKKNPSTANRLKVEATDDRLKKEIDIFLKFYMKAKLSSMKVKR